MPPNRPGHSAEAEAVPRRQVVGTIALGMLMVAGFGLGLSAIDRRSSEALDEQMGERLVLIAQEAAATVPADSLLAWSFLEGSQLVQATRTVGRRLRDLAARRDLNYVVVYSFEHRVLVDTSHLRPPGQPDPYLFDHEPLDLALDGAALHTPTQELAGEWLKSAWVPVRSADGRIDGAVAVQALPDFFDTLRALRRTLWLVGLGVTLLVTVLIVSYLRFARRMARARAALVRSETLSAMGRMAAGIAHEIRNPLGIIKNTAQVLRAELEEEGRETDLIDFIPEEVDRLNETLTGYLEFAKDAPLRPEDTDLVRLCRRTLRLVQRDLERASVRPLDNLDEVGQLSVRADPRRLQQVLLNLVLNAVQAMPEGGELELRLDREPGEVRLSVRDTGVGMDEAARAAIFEPFFTSKEKGSGLGLSVARRIVEDHGGRIEVESAPGRGSTFTLVLPAAAG